MITTKQTLDRLEFMAKASAKTRYIRLDAPEFRALIADIITIRQALTDLFEDDCGLHQWDPLDNECYCPFCQTRWKLPEQQEHHAAECPVRRMREWLGEGK